MLSYAFWQQRYGGDRSILGTKIDINGVSVEIVGVGNAALRSAAH